LGPSGTRTVFQLSDMTGITFNQHTHQNPVVLTPATLTFSLLKIIPGAVGQVAFGKYPSPDYLIHPGEYIPEVGTLTGVPQVQSTNDVYFNLFLPSGSPPPAGWPVAIFQHGSATNKNNQPLEVAATLASHGVATIAINMWGNGLGGLRTLTVNPPAGGALTFAAGGRSVDQNNDNNIVDGEGRSAAAPRTLISSRDAAIQTIADLMQLVRVIEGGMDVDGDSLPDLDPARITFFGHSLGGMWGTM